VNLNSRTAVVLERVAIVVASLALSTGASLLLSGYFAGNDQAGVTGSAVGPGQAFRDLGHAHLPPGRLQPPYDSNPPTSGAHVPEPVTRDERVLNDNQLLQALELGNVVMMYGGRTSPPGLRALGDAVAGPFTPKLEATGLAVVLARRPGTAGLIGLAWAHMLTARSPSDPLLRQFAQFWLGKGAPGHLPGGG
jgi:Protein of unknown function (DUF3105)